MSETNKENLEQAEATEAVKAPDVLDQLLKPEVQASLTTLVEQLPKLAEMMEMMTKTYDLAKKVASDRVLVEDTIGGIKDVVEPLGEKVKACASAVIEANDRAEESDETIGLFGMIRILKDPELQRMLRFGQAYLEIVGERKAKSEEN